MDELYKGEDGLLYCSKCGEPREYIVKLFGSDMKVRVTCDCKKKQKSEQEEREEREERGRRRTQGNVPPNFFITSDETPQSKFARNYAKNFPKYRQDGKGLILYGGVGTGKTHLAACICNELIDMGYKVLMTNFTTLTNGLLNADNKNEYMRSLNQYALLVLDDLGAERKSEYMQEQVFQIIDNRYQRKLPIIVTTNMIGKELGEPTNTTDARILDRIVAMCHPIEFDGKSKRRESARADYKQMKEELNADD